MEKFTNELKYFAITWCVLFSIFELLEWFVVPTLGYWEFPYIFLVSLSLVIVAQIVGKKLCYRNFYDKRIYTEPIIGYRSWSVSEKGRLYPLTSDHSDDMWPPMKRFDAGCAKLHSHRCPDLDCTCGIYAFKRNSRSPFGEVWGEVYLWGKIIETTHGYRAEYAYPKKLYVHQVFEEYLVKIKNNYACDIQVYKPLEDKN